jgi:dihydropteroate synthase
MGILNVTDDSFSDGGRFLSAEKAFEQACYLIEKGADLIDIGGESSRPSAMSVSLDVELSRVIPVIERLHRHTKVCISIDTYKPEVMQAAVQAGAQMINDIYALRQPGAVEMAAKLAVPVSLMHMKGTPATMQENPVYLSGIMPELQSFFTERIESCLAAGIGMNQLILDPGFGFGKLAKDNLKLVNRLSELQQFHLPLLLGCSRKQTIGDILNKKTDERLIGSIAVALYAALQGAGILRVHDVDETRQALAIIEAISLCE